MTTHEAAIAPATPPVIRECGSCMLCCKLFPVKHFDKPAGKWCVHAKPGSGCAIHETRPNVCRSFQCEWTTNALMPADWQPDKAKFFIFRSRPNQYDILVESGAPHSWRSEKYYAPIKQIAASYADQGVLVIVSIGSKRIVLLPDRDVDLGTRAEGKEIILIRETGPQGVRYDVEIGGEDKNAPQEPV